MYEDLLTEMEKRLNIDNLLDADGSGEERIGFIRGARYALQVARAIAEDSQDDTERIEVRSSG